MFRNNSLKINQNKLYKGQKTVHFAKGTNTETSSSKPESGKEIEGVSYNETENEGTPIHTDLSDLKISTDDSDF